MDSTLEPTGLQLGKVATPWRPLTACSCDCSYVGDRAGDGAEEPSGLDWAARVQRLEAEVDGLRRAMRSRAVIEQAKGFLSATLSTSLDEAFGHLARLSQYENLRVAEVAARIIGAAMPTGSAEPEPEPEPVEPRPVDARRFDPLTYLHGPPADGGEAEEPLDPVDLPVLPAESRVRLQTAGAAVQSAESLTELADRLLDEGAGWLGADAVTIWTSEPDGALRLVACAGLAPQVASDWQRIPSRVNAPVRDAISRDEPIWLDGQQPHQYVIMQENTSGASLPLRQNGRPFAALAFAWHGPHPYPEPERRYLTGLAALAARRFRYLARSTGIGDQPGHWLQGVLDALPVEAMLLAPVRDDDGAIVDFIVDYASPTSGDVDHQVPGEMVGRRLLDIRPHLANVGVFDAYRDLVLAGGTWKRAAEPEALLVDGAPQQRVISRSAIRLGEGLLVAWRTHDAEAQLDRVTRTEELAGLGYLEWDLATETVHWSPGTYRIFDRSPQRGPLSLEQFPDHVVPDDLPALEKELRGLLDRREPVDMPIRLRVSGGERLVWAVLRPRLDAGGDLVGLYGVVQDLSEFQRRNEALRRNEHAAKIRRVHGAVPPGRGR
jgi:PAS domain-containing protein